MEVNYVCVYSLHLCLHYEMLNVDVSLRLYIISNVGLHSSRNPVVVTSTAKYYQTDLRQTFS